MQLEAAQTERLLAPQPFASMVLPPLHNYSEKRKGGSKPPYRPEARTEANHPCLSGLCASPNKSTPARPRSDSWPVARALLLKQANGTFPGITQDCVGGNRLG